ncbi:MAG: type II toxin-antitoxin system Phd/YefM family antitoxin [Proteobacteria bacterium]|nr:type II toxin-antitoxin system Phd/YefM family antitoxin [Pseudomonadota bacterium]
MHTIFSKLTASITELKKHPMETIRKSQGEPLAILSHNEPVFYCIPAKTFEVLMDILEDAELVNLVHARAGEKEIEVNINDL